MISNSIDADLIKAIINRCIAMALGGTLNITSIDHDTQNIEYCPVWTLSTTGGKKLLKIKVRMTGDKSFLDVDGSDLGSTGLTINEMLEYLDRSDAVRVTASRVA
jgi:hypothetical protein